MIQSAITETCLFQAPETPEGVIEFYGACSEFGSDRLCSRHKATLSGPS